MSTRKDPAAEVFDALSDDQKAAANAAFQAASDTLKTIFGLPVSYDDRAERLVHHIAVYMVECAPNTDPATTTI